MYLDPGFGSMLIQVLIAGLAVAGATLGIFRHKLLLFFKKNKELNDNKDMQEDKNDIDE